jgi:hypothetical protein
MVSEAQVRAETENDPELAEWWAKEGSGYGPQAIRALHVAAVVAVSRLGGTLSFTEDDYHNLRNGALAISITNDRYNVSNLDLKGGGPVS